MPFSFGLVGLPNAGKSTLFKALTHRSVTIEAYPFSTVEPNTGFVIVEDQRLAGLGRLSGMPKQTPLALEIIDIAGLVKGASQGEGLGNQFLAHIRECNAILHVVRCFEGLSREVNPAQDVAVVQTELLLADIQTVEKRMEKISGAARAGQPPFKEEKEILTEVRNRLSRMEHPGCTAWTQKEMEYVSALNLLTQKPVLYVGNVDEAVTPYEEAFCALAERNRLSYFCLCARALSDLAEFSDAEREALLLDYEEKGRSLNAAPLLHQMMSLLRLITFFTVAGEKEVRAWCVREGTPAVEAASKVHSDIARGFIKAEVIPFSKLMDAGSWSAAKEQGLLRAEGKSYPVHEGDVVYFHFKA